MCPVGGPCLRVPRFTIWNIQSCCRVEGWLGGGDQGEGAGRVPRGRLLTREERLPQVSVSRLSKQGHGLDRPACCPVCTFTSKCLKTPCRGRHSARQTRDAPGSLQLASRPPPVPTAPVPGLVSSPPDRARLPRCAWRLWTAFRCFHVPSRE